MLGRSTPICFFCSIWKEKLPFYNFQPKILQIEIGGVFVQFPEYVLTSRTGLPVHIPFFLRRLYFGMAKSTEKEGAFRSIHDCAKALRCLGQGGGILDTEIQHKCRTDLPRAFGAAYICAFSCSILFERTKGGPATDGRSFSQRRPGRHLRPDTEHSVHGTCL